jgi:hypothetical protein
MLGSAIRIVADAQEYFTLRLKRDLITDGMYRYIPALRDGSMALALAAGRQV